MQVSPLDLVATLLFLVALFGWINLRTLHLPTTVGLMGIGLLGALAVLVLDHLFPQFRLAQSLTGLMQQLDFSKAVLKFLLGFLMFAAGMSLNEGALRGTEWTAAVLATLGTITSALLFGAGFYALTGAFGITLSFTWCLVFGALISPTDPAAMLANIKYIPLPEQVKALLQGESLFNDGMGIVLFTALLASAAGGTPLELGPIARKVVTEGLGAALLGAAAAYVALRAMREIDDYGVETAITIALATGAYAAADHLGISGPIATAMAGVLVGTERAKQAMSETTQRYVRGFWNLMDEILNAVLFLLIGLEVIAVDFVWTFVGPALCAIALLLAARLLSVSIPAALLARSRESIGYWIIPVLTWSGARGGISVALALLLPPSPGRTLILTATYAVVLFSVFVQSMTMPAVIRRFQPAALED